MNKLLWIAGVLILSGTEAFAANLGPMNMLKSELKTQDLLSRQTKQDQAITTDSYLNFPSHSVNHREALSREILLAYEDEGRGSPDKRGEGGNR